jgi:hypothetical protein
MPASSASTQLESDLPRFGNPARFNKFGKCSRRGREGSVSARASKYQLIPNMPEHRLRPLIERFTELLAQQPVFVEMFGAVQE